MNRAKAIAAVIGAATVAAASTASAREYFVGGPVVLHDMEIVANYLVGVQMAPMSMPMPSGPDVIHLEADIHATADNKYGFPDGAWMPYLTVKYHLEKVGSAWKADGTLLPMTAADGPHYANNVKMGGAGRYKVTYTISSPESNGFLHHTDKATGVPNWWAPFNTAFTFSYPQK